MVVIVCLKLKTSAFNSSNNKQAVGIQFLLEPSPLNQKLMRFSILSTQPGFQWMSQPPKLLLNCVGHFKIQSISRQKQIQWIFPPCLTLKIDYLNLEAQI